MIFILLICLIAIFLISYFYTRRIMSPACIISGVYIISVYLAILNIKMWSIEISAQTVELIIIGVLSFVIPSIIITILYSYINKRRSISKQEDFSKHKMKEIKVDNILLNIMIIFQIITTILYAYYCYKSIGTGLNISNFASKMVEYRNLKMIDDDSLITIPFFLKQMLKISKAIIYCYTFVIINNIIVYKRKKEKNRFPLKWSIMMLLLFVQTVFSASRFDLAIIASFILTVFYLLFFNDKTKVNFKIAIKTLLIIVVIGFLFSFTKELFGRYSEKTTMQYISSYFGGPIELLDLYVKNPPPKSNIWGKETFFSINNSLINDPSQKYTIHLEFRQSNGIWIGNVYTALRMYFQDFGILGVIILQALYSALITLLFLSCLKNGTNKMPLKVIIYGVISFSLFLHSYRDFFYSTIISVNYLNIFFYIILIRYLFLNLKFKGLK